MADPYFAEPGVLRNLLGIADQDALAIAETDLVEARALEWAGARLPTYDSAHLKGIHHHLFQDVYDWAGQFRRVGIGKGGPDGFWPYDTLESRAQRIFTRLATSNLLDPTVTDTDFLSGIALLYLDVNHLHPFREGNGRTQRIFLNEVASVSKRVILWRHVTREANDSACADSMLTQSPRRLAELLGDVVVVEQNDENRQLLALSSIDDLPADPSS